MTQGRPLSGKKKKAPEPVGRPIIAPRGTFAKLKAKLSLTPIGNSPRFTTVPNAIAARIARRATIARPLVAAVLLGHSHAMRGLQAHG